MLPDYPQYLDRLRLEDPALAAELTEHTSLEKVIGWLHRCGMSLDLIESIPQDEYSHDVLMPLPDGRWLAFAVT